MKKIIFILGCIVVFVSCTPNEYHIKFNVHNSASNKIFVQYCPFQTTDTTNVQIIPGQTIVVWDALHVGGKSYDTNWYYDFGINIISICNIVGDPTIFDPNVASHWQISNSDETEYMLSIGNSSF